MTEVSIIKVMLPTFVKHNNLFSLTTTVFLICRLEGLFLLSGNKQEFMPKLSSTTTTKKLRLLSENILIKWKNFTIKCSASICSANRKVDKLI